MASFVIPDSICPGGIASISNNSDFGCQNSLNPNYQPDNYVDVSPSFYYDWGNCSTSTYIPSEGQYEDQNFISVQNTNIYNSPGTYYIELSVSIRVLPLMLMIQLMFFLHLCHVLHQVKCAITTQQNLCHGISLHSLQMTQ